MNIQTTKQANPAPFVKASFAVGKPNKKNKALFKAMTTSKPKNSKKTAKKPKFTRLYQTTLNPKFANNTLSLFDKASDKGLLVDDLLKNAITSEDYGQLQYSLQNDLTHKQANELFSSPRILRLFESIKEMNQLELYEERVKQQKKQDKKAQGNLVVSVQLQKGKNRKIVQFETQRKLTDSFSHYGKIETMGIVEREKFNALKNAAKISGKPVTHTVTKGKTEFCLVFSPTTKQEKPKTQKGKTRKTSKRKTTKQKA